MSTTAELRQLLSRLIEAWPDDHDHPMVEHAREYLDLSTVASQGKEVIGEQYPYAGDRDGDDSAWFAL